MTRARDVVGDVPCLALRVTYVGELGWELYPRAEFAGACGTRWSRPASRTACSPPATARSTRCVWRRGIAPGDRTSRPRNTRSRRDWGSRWRLDVPGVHRQRGVGAGARGRGDAPAVVPDAHGRASDDARQRAGAGGGDVVSRVTSGGIGYAVGSSIAFAYLPVELAVPGTASRSRCSASGSARGRRDEPLWDPKGERIRCVDGRRDVLAHEHEPFQYASRRLVFLRNPLRSNGARRVRRACRSRSGPRSPRPTRREPVWTCGAAGELLRRLAPGGYRCDSSQT